MRLSTHFFRNQQKYIERKDDSENHAHSPISRSENRSLLFLISVEQMLWTTSVTTMEHLIMMHIIWTRPSLLSLHFRLLLQFSSNFLSNSIHFDFISIFCMIFSPRRRLNWKNEKLIRYESHVRWKHILWDCCVTIATSKQIDGLAELSETTQNIRAQIWSENPKECRPESDRVVKVPSVPSQFARWSTFTFSSFAYHRPD